MLRSPRPADGSRTSLRTCATTSIATIAGFLGAVSILTGRSGVLRPIVYPAVAAGREIAAGPTFRSVARDGWSYPEDWGIWTKGSEATLEIPLADAPTSGVRLSVKGVFFVMPKHESVTASFTANGMPIGVMKGTVAASEAETLLNVPQAAFAASPRMLKLKIAVDKPIAPAALEPTDDTRLLGFGLKSMMLVDGGGVP